MTTPTDTPEPANEPTPLNFDEWINMAEATEDELADSMENAMPAVEMEAPPKPATLTHMVDVHAMMGWLQYMGTCAMQDVFDALKNDEFAAAKAHYERINTLQCVAPWIGAVGGTRLSLRMGYTTIKP